MNKKMLHQYFFRGSIILYNTTFEKAGPEPKYK